MHAGGREAAGGDGEGWGEEEERSVQRVIFGASHAYGTPLEGALARRRDAPRSEAASTAGAVVYIEWPAGGRQCVWYIPALRALVEPDTRALAQRAAARGTFGVWCKGRGELASTQCVALSAAPRAAGEPGLAAAVAAAWGAARAARVRRWAAAAPAPLLPPTLKQLAAYHETARRIAEEEEKAGQAGVRSERSLELRAAGIMLAVHMQRELLAGSGAGAPAALHRRAVGKAITNMLSEGMEPPKPQHWDIEAIVDKANWRRVTRQECGFDSWSPRPEPRPGELRMVCARSLGQAYLEAVGPGGVSDDSPIWTVLNECRGHTQAVAPHLVEALKAAHGRGEPFWMFDRAALEPAPKGREGELFWGEIARLQAQGTLVELSEDDQRDPAKCAAVAYLGCTFKGSLARSAEEEKAVAEGDQAAIARLAEARARATLLSLQRTLAEGGRDVGERERDTAAAAPERASAAAPERAIAEAARGRQAYASVLLEQLLAADAQSISKARPVARFQWLSRGCEKVGLAPDGVFPSGCQPPQLIRLLAEAKLGDCIARCDAKDYFYTLPLSAEGKALSCLAVWDPAAGKLRVFQLQALCMEQTCSPAMAQVISSTVALIANARGAANASCPGWAALCDDFICVAPRAALQRATDIMVDLMAQVGMTEAVAKRVFGTKGEIMGKEFDMEAGTVRVPPGRLHKYVYHLHLALAALSSEDTALHAAVSVDFLSRLTGTLGWISETLTSGTLHLNALYAATSGKKTVAQCRERIVEELQWWAAQASAGRLNTTLRLGEVDAARTVTLDASDKAIAAVGRDGAVWRELTARERTMSSTRRELRAMALAADMEGAAHAGATLVLCSDSLAAVCSFNKGRVRGKGRKDLASVYDALERHGCHAVALWLPREWNRVADGASKAATAAEFEEWAHARGLQP
jgi:hypothetical protein